MNKPLTLGSLFDGSGGFPLAGLLAGIVPVWSSEIEPFPIRVTEKRLPQVQHFGNISGLHGAKLPPVDIITFGSPCQDMSIAGKRTGLSGSRSSLFHEAIRIIREMRCASNGKYPRYIVWENVPGAFSSNGGEDFRCVLEAICSVKDSSISIPRPAGKWTKAGEILAESYSLAWRVLDAQYWGVPQRRKRIFLVADFDGASAGKILFESEGLSGYSAESLRAWQRAAGSAADSFGTAGLCLCDQGGERIDILKERAATLRAEAHHPPCVLENHPADSRLQISENGKVQTLTSRCGTGGGNVPLLMDTPKTLKIRCGKAGGGKGSLIQENKSATLLARDHKDPSIVSSGYAVRRLTPQECARLQGFPDQWCSDLASENPTEEEIDRWAAIFEEYRKAVKPESRPKSRKTVQKWLQDPYRDAAEYRLWGNGICLNVAVFVLAGIVWADL